MDDFLPFHYCDDKEFFDLLPVIKSKLKSKISRSSIAQNPSLLSIYRLRNAKRMFNQ